MARTTTRTAPRTTRGPEISVALCSMGPEGRHEERRGIVTQCTTPRHPMAMTGPFRGRLRSPIRPDPSFEMLVMTWEGVRVLIVAGSRLVTAILVVLAMRMLQGLGKIMRTQHMLIAAPFRETTVGMHHAMNESMHTDHAMIAGMQHATTADMRMPLAMNGLMRPVTLAMPADTHHTTTADTHHTTTAYMRFAMNGRMRHVTLAMPADTHHTTTADMRLAMNGLMHPVMLVMTACMRPTMNGGMHHAMTADLPRGLSETPTEPLMRAPLRCQRSIPMAPATVGTRAVRGMDLRQGLPVTIVPHMQHRRTCRRLAMTAGRPLRAGQDTILGPTASHTVHTSVTTGACSVIDGGMLNAFSRLLFSR